MQILCDEKEGDEKMTQRKFYLAFLLILGLLVFAGCATYDGMPDTGDRNRVMDNNGTGNNWDTNNTNPNQGGAGGNGNTNPNNWNTNPNNGTNNNNLNR